MNLPEEPENSSPPINLIPMIDVIFAILTFFIMSTLFLSRSEGLPVDLPQATTSEIQQQQSTPITITLDKQGNLFLNRKPVQIATLETEIRLLIASGQQVLVVINADQAVTHGQVVSLMDKLRSLSGVRIAIATSK